MANHYDSHSQYKDQPGLLTLFSGDAFNPSLESSVTKGRHMVPILNNLKTAVACVGVSMQAFSFSVAPPIAGSRALSDGFGLLES